MRTAQADPAEPVGADLEARRVELPVVRVVGEHLDRWLVPDGDVVAALTRSTLEGAADLRVPLEVDLAFGASWADAKA